MTITLPLAIVLSVAIICATALAALKLVPVALATGAIGAVVGWLVPNPKLPEAK